MLRDMLDADKAADEIAAELDRTRWAGIRAGSQWPILRRRGSSRQRLIEKP